MDKYARMLLAGLLDNGRASYADLARFAADQRDLFDAAEEPMACFCGD